MGQIPRSIERISSWR